MSAIFHIPIVAFVHEEYKQDNSLESAATAVVQAILPICFPPHENWLSRYEVPPNHGEHRHYRIDALVFELGGRVREMVPRLLVEIKGGGGSPRAVETQALANARATLQGYRGRHTLFGIFVETLIGIERCLCFRFWWVSARDLTLAPLDGGPESGRTRQGYVDVSTDDGRLLSRYHDQVKAGVPEFPVDEPPPQQDEPMHQESFVPYGQPEFAAPDQSTDQRSYHEDEQEGVGMESASHSYQEEQRLDDEDQRRLGGEFSMQGENQQSEQDFDMQDGGREEGSFSMEPTSVSAPGGMSVDDDPGQSTNVQRQQSVDAPEEQSLYHIVQPSWHRTKKGGFLLAFEHEGKILNTDPSKWTRATDENNADCYQWHSNTLDEDFRAYTWPPS